MTANSLYGNRDERLKEVLKFHNKTTEDLEEYVAIIKSWFKTQLHLPEIPPKELITSFLIACKFSVEKTKSKMDMYYTIRRLIPDLFQNKNPKSAHMHRVLRHQYNFRLPKLTPEGYRVLLLKHYSNPDRFDNVYDCFAMGLKMVENLQYVDCAKGDIFVGDLAEIKLGHTFKVTPTVIKNVYLAYFRSLPSKLVGFHFINANSYTEQVFNLIKQLIAPKYKDRFHLHRGVEGLLEYVPLDILPSEYGGKELSLPELHNLTLNIFEEFQPRFDELESFKVDESKRPTPLVNDELLGYYGNFRKIEID